MDTEKNPRIATNNWRIACILMARDIRKGGFRIDMKSTDAKSLSDEELSDLLYADLPSTNNVIMDNVLYAIHTLHQKNPLSDKVWRGDIEACYAKLKKNIYVRVRMNMVRKCGFFGFSEEEWEEMASGRATLREMDINIFFEAFRCATDYDAGYLYQRIHYAIDPNPVSGVVCVPICNYEFQRR